MSKMSLVAETKSSKSELVGILTQCGNHSIVSVILSAFVLQMQVFKQRHDSKAGPMHHPSTPWVSHEPLSDGFSCTNTLTPGGAVGVLLKENSPSI